MPIRRKEAVAVVAAPVSCIPAPAVSEPILTIEQVAERLQMKVSQVRELLRRRNKRPLPALKCGGKFLRFKWSMVEVWLHECGEERAVAS